VFLTKNFGLAVLNKFVGPANSLYRGVNDLIVE
jgi:hypothetical protein